MAQANVRAEESFERAKKSEAAGNPSDAIQFYLDGVELDPTGNNAPRGLFRVGELYTYKKEYRNAFASYQQLLDSANDGGFFLRAVQNQFRIAEKVVNKIINQSAQLEPVRETEKLTYKDASAMLGLILKSGTQTEFAPRATFLLSALQAKEGDRSTARETLSQFITSYPDHSLVDDAEFQLAYYDYQDGIVGRGDSAPLERAGDALIFFLAKRTHSDRLAVAQILINDIHQRQYSGLRAAADHYDRTGKSEAAKTTYREIERRFPDLLAKENQETKKSAKNRGAESSNPTPP